MDYFSEKELVLQTGHDREHWPEVALKELVDNALDAAEDSGISPEINVAVEDDTISVADNGPGIGPDVIARILDFSTKTSSKDFYVSPTRGAQGNALKTLLAMPYVLSGGLSGQVETSSQGIRHVITVAVDRIRQEPVLRHDQQACDVKTGTVVKIHWPDLASSEGKDREFSFLQRLWAYAVLNRHASFEYRHHGEVRLSERASAPHWEKWRPSDPTSPHWYDVEQLRSLIAAYITTEQAGGPVHFVRDFVAEFRGLSGTAKQGRILEETGLAGKRLSDLVCGREVDREATAGLLQAMRRESRELKPQALGIIGEQHIRQKLGAAGCNVNSIRYKRVVGVDQQRRPFVIETAFGVFEGKNSIQNHGLLCGLNFTPSIGNPFRRLNGWESLDEVLGEQFVQDDSPTFTLVHLATPYLKYTDRGKSAVELNS
ncbi:MAG: ATP-binding protein [Chloroflexi bacterium]|nr:ATP-binding protein [Chloroflexota bacterium]